MITLLIGVIAASFGGVSVLAMLGTILFKTGRASATSYAAREAINVKLDNMLKTSQATNKSYVETIDYKLDGIAENIKRINGTVADVVKVQHRQELRIQRIEYEQEDASRSTDLGDGG